MREALDYAPLVMLGILLLEVMFWIFAWRGVSSLLDQIRQARKP